MDDQTIYQWRGSDVENILTFQKRYPKVNQIRLEENFRSSEGIAHDPLLLRTRCYEEDKAAHHAATLLYIPLPALEQWRTIKRFHV